MSVFLRACWIFFEAHLGRSFRTRRGWIAVALALLPVVLAAVVKVVSRFEGPAPTEVLLALLWFLMLQTMVPLVAMVMASSVIAEEIEDRTITYLFTRPIPRAAILIGRWLAVALPISGILCGAAELMLRIVSTTGGPQAVVEWMPEGFHGRYLLAVLMGSLVYSALFAAAGALFKHPMLLGLGYVFVYEGFLGNLPGSTQKGTVLFYLKSFLLERYPSLAGEMEEALFSATLAEGGEAMRRLALILAVGLALGAWRFSRREYVLAA